MTENFDRDPAADALRAVLAERARQAPSGELAAERIIRAAERPVGARRPARRSWPTWALPLIAAGAVAAVVGAVAGIESYSSQASTRQPAGSPSAVVTAPLLAPVPTPTTVASAPASVAAPADTATLHGVRILDLTFAGVDDGWALASADCVTGNGRCTALLRTTNGRTWTSMPGAAFNVAGVEDCADPCVAHLRFATDEIGYAFGPSALLMTTDGGRSWSRQPGGADALETLDGNVIRISSSGAGCPGPCDVRVQTAALGSGSWKASDLGGLPDHATAGLAFARGGHDAYLLFIGNPAGGANLATSTLFRSSDDGKTWESVHEPCPSIGAEVDSYAIAAAAGGRVSILCSVRQATSHPSFVATSFDHGRMFASGGYLQFESPPQFIAGDAAAVLVVGSDGLARSTDQGTSWTTVGRQLGRVQFLGFESPQVGRAVPDGGRAIWTTRDGGRTWTETSLG